MKQTLLIITALMLMLGCSGDDKQETYDFMNDDGLRTGYYENGQKKWEATYKDGKVVGKWTYWYENGQKRWENTYKDGELIKETSWDKYGNKK